MSDTLQLVVTQQTLTTKTQALSEKEPSLILPSRALVSLWLAFSCHDQLKHIGHF